MCTRDLQSLRISQEKWKGENLPFFTNKCAYGSPGCNNEGLQGSITRGTAEQRAAQEPLVASAGMCEEPQKQDPGSQARVNGESSEVFIQDPSSCKRGVTCEVPSFSEILIPAATILVPFSF